MNILSLKVKNFRSFGGNGEVTIVLRKGINVIVGENNVGKSSLFKALQIISKQISTPQSLDFYKGSATEWLLEAELELNNDELKELLSNISGNNSLLRKPENFIRFVKDFGNKFVLTVSSRNDLSIKTSNLAFTGTAAQLSAYFNPSVTYDYQLNSFLKNYFSKSKNTIASLLKEEETTKERPRLIWQGNPASFIQNLFQNRLKVFTEIRKRPEGSNERILESLDGGQVASVLFSLKVGNREENRKYQMIQQEFSRLYNDLNLEVRGTGPKNTPRIYIQKLSINYDMPIENVGAGIGEMIIVLTHLVDSKDLIFGLDMPEMQFHPHAQRLLLKVLENHAKSNQILIVTHSPMLLNPRNLRNIIIIRERNGRSRASQLSDGYFNQREEARLERLLLDDSRDFFFSRATLIVEGPTETGALPIFSKKVNFDFDIQGISLVKMDSNYFGLWDKLLSGFDIPHTAMCDKDALMHVDGSTKFEEERVKTSPVFCSLAEANRLTKDDKKKISEVQSKIIKVKRKNIYPDELFEELKSIAEKQSVYVLSSDFEGILEEKGFGDLLKKAHSISRSKAIQGRFVAERILAKGAEIPSEFITVINAVKKLASVSSD